MVCVGTLGLNMKDIPPLVKKKSGKGRAFFSIVEIKGMTRRETDIGLHMPHRSNVSAGVGI